MNRTTRWCALSFLSLVFLPAALVQAGERDVWLVSARGFGSCDSKPSLTYWRYAAGTWNAATQDELFTAPPLPTCVWTHGNWVSHDRAATMGWHVYEQFKSCGAGDASFRMIIFSWPTERQGKVRQDARAKAIAAEEYAWPLAWVVDRLPPETPVSLLGFSYGARLNSATLHLLGGGELCGRYLERPEGTSAPRQLREILLAAAMDNFVLAPDAQYRNALPAAERIVNIFNARDNVLDLYPLLWRLGGPKAAGYTGLIGYGGPYADKVAEINVTGMLTPKHEWDSYFHAGGLTHQIVAVSLFLDQQPLHPLDVTGAASAQMDPAGPQLLVPATQ